MKYQVTEFSPIEPDGHIWHETFNTIQDAMVKCGEELRYWLNGQHPNWVKDDNNVYTATSGDLSYKVEPIS